jgi:hypothetical protein
MNLKEAAHVLGTGRTGTFGILASQRAEKKAAETAKRK